MCSPAVDAARIIDHIDEIERWAATAWAMCRE